MHEIGVADFDIKHTIESAQPLTFFGDERVDGKGIAYTYRDNLVKVEQNGGRLAYEAYGDLNAAALKREIITRFRLRDNMHEIYEHISTDAFLRKAIQNYKGMRVTKNDPWETTLCFVISQFNNVKRIRGIVKRLIVAYGEEHTVSFGNVKLNFRSFPTPDVLAQRSVKELMTHGAGFRANYIKAIAQECSDSFDLDKLNNKNYTEAKEELMTLHGIGDKVADCILLFGYGKLEAFPVDTWIKRIVEHVYFKGREKNVKQIHEFAEGKWNKNAGYAQQYLYHFARNNSKVEW
jgi:N-glycosylase/DNA lyase